MLLGIGASIERHSSRDAFVALQFVRVPAVRESLTRFFLGGVSTLAVLMTRDGEGYQRRLKEINPDWTKSQIEPAFEFARDSKNYTLSVHSSRAELCEVVRVFTPTPCIVGVRGMP